MMVKPKEEINSDELENFLKTPYSQGILDHNQDIGKLEKIHSSIKQVDQSSLNAPHYFHLFTPVDYLHQIEPSIPRGLISHQKYDMMKTLTSTFRRTITSFFGFETQLDSTDGNADYLFAVSSLHGEKEQLRDMLYDPTFQRLTEISDEWNQLRLFTSQWCSQTSIINRNILGLWLEFDMKETVSQFPTPCVFVQTIPLKNTDNLNWVIHSLIPTLIGKRLQENLEIFFQKTVAMLPDKASVMDIGFMFARAENGIRLMINKIKPEEIVPFLKRIGLPKEDTGLETLIAELKKQVNRIVLHITIGSKLIPKVGIECSFSPDQYSNEKKWGQFFEFLIRKNLCIKEKKDMLEEFTGLEISNNEINFDINDFLPAVKTREDTTQVSVISRYISHVKLVYQPGQLLRVKAYPAVKLFNKKN